MITPMHRCVAYSLLILLLPLQSGLLAGPDADIEVTIANFVSCNWLGSPQDCFPMEAFVYFNITLANLTLDPQGVTIDVSVLDCTNVPIGLDQLYPTLPPNETSHYIMSVFIPNHARLGIATAYASVFSDGWLVDTKSTQFRIDAPDLIPPVVTLLSPMNVTYGIGSVPLVVAVDERPFWAGYSLNGQENVTIEGNLTLASLVNGQYRLVVYASDASGNVGLSQVHFTVLIIHDVAVIDFYCTPQKFFAGQLVSISVSVQNEGTVAETFDVSILVNNATIETLTVTDLPAGNTTDLYLTWDTAGTTKGNYTITSSVHVILGEIDTADNTADRIVTVMTRPDIAVANVVVLKTVVGQGYPVQVNITVMNQGDLTETFNVSVHANSELVLTQSITLASRTSTFVTFSWDTADCAKGNYTITAMAWPVLNEVDTADNTLSSGPVLVTIPGDNNGDCRVNLFDIVRVANVYATSQTTDPQYDPNCDIDGDGVVDLFDLVLTAGHYGENW